MERTIGVPPSPAGMVWRGVLAALLLLCAGAAQARIEVSEVEMKMLPRYCPDTMGFGQYGDAHSNTSPRAGYWISLMGPSFWHMHHYCVSLVLMNRALKAQLTRDQRKNLWKGAQANYLYVTERAESGFIMLPEIYTRLGDVELLLASPDKAEQAYAHARKAKPDYWPAYTHWAEYLMRNGKRSEAMQVVRSGLEQAPDAKVLLEQYRMLGGKPSDLPKPVIKAPAEKTPAEQAPDQGTPTEKPPADAPTEAPGAETANPPTATPSTATTAGETVPTPAGAPADAQ